MRHAADIAVFQKLVAEAIFKRQMESPIKSRDGSRKIPVEYVEELGVLILRGAKEDVEKIQKIIAEIE